ncbi:MULTISPECIES: IS5 family transposase [unclassified Rhizobium]|uniref:IS5 family transposase n=1 Tax=unclassified Rhizobium TaxID=2613769 RepID=UPI00244EE8BE|nr:MULTISPECIES: IS5 family transposase [unclassified Rhizobium]
MHARADGQGRPLGFVLTGGETSDYLAVPDLLAMPVNRPRRLLADKGYDADSIRQELLFHGTRPIIPPRAGRKNPPACDYHAYKDRNRIERMFNRIKQFRRIATRYDKTKTSFAAFLAIAATKIWLPHFVNMA